MPGWGTASYVARPKTGGSPIASSMLQNNVGVGTAGGLSTVPGHIQPSGLDSATGTLVRPPVTHNVGPGAGVPPPPNDVVAKEEPTPTSGTGLEVYYGGAAPPEGGWQGFNPNGTPTANYLTSNPNYQAQMDERQRNLELAATMNNRGAQIGTNVVDLQGARYGGLSESDLFGVRGALANSPEGWALNNALLKKYGSQEAINQKINQFDSVNRFKNFTPWQKLGTASAMGQDQGGGPPPQGGGGGGALPPPSTGASPNQQWLGNWWDHPNAGGAAPTAVPQAAVPPGVSPEVQPTRLPPPPEPMIQPGPSAVPGSLGVGGGRPPPGLIGGQPGPSQIGGIRGIPGIPGGTPGPVPLNWLYQNLLNGG